jgi:hypothetical protein
MSYGAEVGRVNMPAAPAEITNTTSALTAIANGDPSEIRIAKSAVKQGSNLLAISVHNSALTSSDLTFIPVVARLGGAPAGQRFRRGDVNNNASVELADGLSLLNYLFQNGPTPVCLDTADLNDDGRTNLTDALVLLNYLFLEGPPPSPPGFACGPDPTPDSLGECASAGC